MIDHDAVESALDEAGLAWKKREGGWMIPASARVPCEIDLVANEGELILEAMLASWDTIGQRERAALGRLLETAAGQMAGVSFVVGERRASMMAKVSAEHDLSRAIGRLLRASRLLSREAAALLEVDMADRYLSFFGASA